MNKIWFPFSQEKGSRNKIKIVSGKDEYLFDEKGNKYIDLIASWWTNIHGHCNSEISNAISEQAKTLEHVIFADFTHPQAEALVQNLDSATNQTFEKFFFSDNGSTAVEVGLKVAHQYWKNKGIAGKNLILAFNGGYHGDTLGSMSVSKESGYFTPFEDIMTEVKFIPYPETWIDDQDIATKESNSIAELHRIIKEHKARISSIILEPLIQGASGMRISRISFLEQVVQVCQENNIIVIFDEVMTGFYRTGKFFAYQHLSCSPDILCMSKGITGGFLPLSITAVSGKIYDAFYGDSANLAFLHGHSYTANPISCAAANKSFELIQKDETIEKIANIAQIYQDFIPKLQQNQEVSKIRTLGTVLAFNYSAKENLTELKHIFLENGLNIRPLKNNIYILPPYCITKENLSNSLERMLGLL
jgi:adenosylmethionine---8-amino-7-oxononanoate aminotransferase